MTEMNSAKRTWMLTLHPKHLALSDPSGVQPYTLTHEEMMRSAMVIEGMRALALSKPVKMTFKLAPETLSALVEWIGKPALARFYLRRRYAWVLPVATLWILGSMPIAGDPASGREAQPMDLIDSLWFLVMAGHLAMEVASGRSKGWLVLMALMLWMVLTGFKHFIRFKGTRIELATSPSTDRPNSK